MKTIKADYTVIVTMAGPVKFYKNECPYSIKGIGGRKSYVGSTDCQMCSFFGGKQQSLNGTIVEEEINCKHEI